MKRATPQARGHAPGRALGDVGRARRFELAGGAELWRLDAADLRIAERLSSLGASGIGGFVDSGQDDDGAWLVRAPRTPTLADWIKRGDEPRPWREALTLVRSLAEVLAAAEADYLFPGVLAPGAVVVREDGKGVELSADSLVHTLVGASAAGDGATPGDSASPRWTAPEQAAGAPWDNAANRYVLGLVAYRLLAGEHAFGGRGLRLGMDEQARRAPPPFPDEVARALPPGAMSAVLRWLDPDPAKRPAGAADMAERIGYWLDHDERAAEAAPPTPAPTSAGSDPPKPPVEPSSRPPRMAPRDPAPTRRRWSERLTTLVPPIVGLGLALLAVRALGSKPEAPVTARERAPLTARSTLSSDCASCHPRQTGEWHRSVMAHSVKSPLFQALEILIQEQAGRDFDCPNGAGILRKADARTACRDRVSGLPVTGSGGEHWCVNCHAPTENLEPSVPAWDGRGGNASSRLPLRDVLTERAMEGISCGLCHRVTGPVRPGDLARGGYEGNPFWTSVTTGQRFPARPEDRRGLFGIANSGYAYDADLLTVVSAQTELVPGGAHARATTATKEYLRSSEFCGACHDVRLFGSDVIGVRDRGEHFKRLRNAYSEWATWAESERRAGRTAASCQDCHMSSFPGVCEPGAGPSGGGCPPGTRFSPRAPGSYPPGRAATSSSTAVPVRPHYFSGVDVPLSDEFPVELIDERTLDVMGIPLGARQRRNLLLAASVDLELGVPSRRGRLLQVPVSVENVGAGHRVPAGFSQERELWIELTVTDGSGRVVYQVGRVDRDDEDLRDKRFLRVTTDDRFRDGQGRPLGLFGADVADGPDVPRWTPDPRRGGTQFRGQGLVNFQNGFLRCVVCIGIVDAAGRCQPLPGQDRTRADRYADGAYDPDTGECRSNLSGDEALFEIYYPVGALDASRGVLKAPDAIIDTRSLPPGVPIRYDYEIDARGAAGPLVVEARLLFRAFPPFLLRAFIDYERRQAALGHRPSGPLIGEGALERLEVVELARARQELR